MYKLEIINHFSLSALFLTLQAGYTKPPVSLHGQLFWREFFYTAGYAIPNFDKMVGNSICTQIPWKENQEFLYAWEHVSG